MPKFVERWEKEWRVGLGMRAGARFLLNCSVIVSIMRHGTLEEAISIDFFLQVM